MRDRVLDRVTDGAVAAGYGLAWAGVRRLPEPAAYAAFRRVADEAWRRRGRGVRRLEANLARVTPAGTDVRALSREGMRSYLRYWCDAFRLPDWSREEITRRTVIHEERILRDALAAGRGVVAVLPHMGNWDQAGAWVVSTGVPITTVAERLKPEPVFERFLAYRRSLGMEVLPLTGATPPFGLLARRLREGRMVCLLGDRDLTATGVEVEFFGAAARMPGGPAALALQTGAALMPASTWYDGPHLHIRMHPLLDPPAGGSRAERVAATTQAVADVFAGAVAERPQHWHMLQRLWVADLAHDPAAAEAAVAGR